MENVCIMFQASSLACKNALLKKENNRNKDIIFIVYNTRRKHYGPIKNNTD